MILQIKAATFFSLKMKKLNEEVIDIGMMLINTPDVNQLANSLELESKISLKNVIVASMLKFCGLIYF